MLSNSFVKQEKKSGKKKLRFVIDSNEYIFAFGPLKDPASYKFLMKLLEAGRLNTVRIPRTIFEEVRRNVSHEAFREFIIFINLLTTVDEDFMVPFELGLKYESMGLKPADAFIAAYTEWVGADALVTENRHFLSRNPNLPFKVLNAESCLKLITASLQ
jgi:predicted nucleic acid-binding protein